MSKRISLQFPSGTWSEIERAAQERGISPEEHIHRVVSGSVVRMSKEKQMFHSEMKQRASERVQALADRAGLEDPAGFSRLSDEEILSVSGFGRSALEKIRAEFPYSG